MIYLKENVTGIDVIIQQAQKKIYGYLAPRWDAGLDGYGRCSLNKSKIEGDRDSIVPEFYVGSGESPNLLYSEGNKFFFTAGSTWEEVGNFSYKTNISVYFILNLKDTKPSIKHRADSEVISDCFTIFQRTGLGFFDVETDIKKVYADFKVKGSEFDNIQPNCVFRFKTKGSRFKINKSCAESIFSQGGLEGEIEYEL